VTIKLRVQARGKSFEKPQAKPFRETLIGTWYSHTVAVPDGSKFVTGVSSTDPWWHVDGGGFPMARRNHSSVRGLPTVQACAWGTRSQSAPGNTRFTLAVTGIISTGGREDNAILAPLQVAQNLCARSQQLSPPAGERLTKPADAFSERDPSKMTPADYDRWYLHFRYHFLDFTPDAARTAGGSKSARFGQVAEGEGRILTRVGRPDVACYDRGAVRGGRSPWAQRPQLLSLRGVSENWIDEGRWARAAAPSACFFCEATISWRSLAELRVTPSVWSWARVLGIGIIRYRSHHFDWSSSHCARAGRRRGPLWDLVPLEQHRAVDPAPILRGGVKT